MKMAAKLQICQNLYDQGFLCKCDDWHETVDDEGQENMLLYHGEGCMAKEKFAELMSFPNEETKS